MEGRPVASSRGGGRAAARVPGSRRHHGASAWQSCQCEIHSTMPCTPSSSSSSLCSTAAYWAARAAGGAAAGSGGSGSASTIPPRANAAAVLPMVLRLVQPQRAVWRSVRAGRVWGGALGQQGMRSDRLTSTQWAVWDLKDARWQEYARQFNGRLKPWRDDTTPIPRASRRFIGCLA